VKILCSLQGGCSVPRIIGVVSAARMVSMRSACGQHAVSMRSVCRKDSGSDTRANGWERQFCRGIVFAHAAKRKAMGCVARRDWLVRGDSRKGMRTDYWWFVLWVINVRLLIEAVIDVFLPEVIDGK
jgi:hypothetical protein